jgi:hypothetical protein
MEPEGSLVSSAATEPSTEAINLVHTLTAYFFKIHCLIILLYFHLLLAHFFRLS